MAAFDGAGTTAWAVPVTGAGNILGLAAALDNDDNACIAGIFDEDVAVDAGTFAVTNGGDDVWVVSRTASGAARWGIGFGSPGSDVGLGAAFAPNGDCIVVGGAQGMVVHDGGAMMTVVGRFTGETEIAGVAASSVGDESGFVVRLPTPWHLRFRKPNDRRPPGFPQRAFALAFGHASRSPGHRDTQLYSASRSRRPCLRIVTSGRSDRASLRV